MSEPYNHKAIEKKWQEYWKEHETFKTDVWDFSKPKYYALDMFPYPSGVGLHAGHPEGYTATDIMSRMKRMQGYNVLHPMGYDSFGLPAEQYAVNTGHHPNGFTQKNIETFSKQLRELGFDYDWSKMISTSDPEFYKWTQWIFKKLYEAGYAKHIDMPVNWCEELGTVLSNDEVIDGKSERGGYPVVRKNMKQWVIDQPAFAEKLLEGLDEIDWPESTKEMQRNWIGKSTGVEVKFQIVGGGEFSIFTTCIETIYGITFMVLAPDGDIVKGLMDRVENKEEVQAYIDETVKKSDMDRTELNKTKSGCELKGLHCINPVNGREVRMFIGDFVLASYGTGAVMAVPTHDQRDFEYAQAHDIEMIQVIDGADVSEHAFEKHDYLGKGCKLINSEEFTGMVVEDAKEAITAKLEKMGVAKRTVNYKFREWIFARQRYWGEPIPIVHCPKCGDVAVPYEELPLRLPKIKDFQPGEDGQSPLAKIDSFVNCKCPKCGGDAKRETDTMPQWAGSSWYFLRYVDPHNTEALADRKKMEYWMPVDWYNGGMEHVTRHMIYSRFWHHFLYDMGIVNTPEPYAKRSAQGMILGSDGDKMSKSKGNVVDPLDIVNEYGADALRTYVLFMGDYGAAAPWNDSSVRGCKRFLERVAGLTDIMTEEPAAKDMEVKIHKAIKKVSSDIEAMKFNTAIACLMTLINEIYAVGKISKDDLVIFIKLLCPFAPHLCEEIWETIGGEGLLSLSQWPEYEESKTVEDSIEIGVQVNGKVRGTIVIPNGCAKEEALELAKKDERVASFLEGKTLVKEIYVPNKIVNFVAK